MISEIPTSQDVHDYSLRIAVVVAAAACFLEEANNLKNDHACLNMKSFCISDEFNFYYRKVYRALDLESTMRYCRKVTVCMLLTELKNMSFNFGISLFECTCSIIGQLWFAFWGVLSVLLFCT
jgi:hypothetical protein